MTDVTSPFSERKAKKQEGIHGGPRKRTRRREGSQFCPGKKRASCLSGQETKKEEPKSYHLSPEADVVVDTSSSSLPPPPRHNHHHHFRHLIPLTPTLSYPLVALDPHLPTRRRLGLRKNGREERWIGALPILQPASKLAACLGPSHLLAPLRASSPISFSFPLLFPASSSCPKLISNALVNMQIAPRRPKGGGRRPRRGSSDGQIAWHHYSSLSQLTPTYLRKKISFCTKGEIAGG